MRKPVSEHSTTIKARKGEASDRQMHHEHQLEAVGGGTVRRMEFSGEKRPVFQEASVEREWNPRGRDSIDDIHFEVDNLGRLRRPSPRARRPSGPPETRRVFETPGGSVKESRLETSEGDRRVLYTSRRRGSQEQDQRFHSGLVDRVIAQRYQGGPTFEQAEDESPRRGWMRKGQKAQAKKPPRDAEVPAAKQKAPKEPAKAKASVEAVEAPVVKPKAAKRSPAKAKPAAKARAKTPSKPSPAKAEPESDYQPQCEAVTAAGRQCRNSAKTRSKYCGSHQGHKARRLEDVLDTKPAHDTKPGVGDRSGTGQCAAYTKDGLQCLNHSRSSSKYCAVHKGYRVPSKAALAKRLDTAPRYAGAKDTLPQLKK